MRNALHLSDLHFGRHDNDVVAGIGTLIETTRPDVIAISGDFTQCARTHEFELARDLLRTLRSPVIVVPGNHDVPLNSLISRWLQPIDRYKRFISEDLHPSYVDEEIAIVGINTAQSLTFKNGRINEQQIERTCQCLNTAPDGSVRIVDTPPIRSAKPRYFRRRCRTRQDGDARAGRVRG